MGLFVVVTSGSTHSHRSFSQLVFVGSWLELRGWGGSDRQTQEIVDVSGGVPVRLGLCDTVTVCVIRAQDE